METITLDQHLDLTEVARQAGVNVEAAMAPDLVSGTPHEIPEDTVIIYGGLRHTINSSEQDAKARVVGLFQRIGKNDLLYVLPDGKWKLRIYDENNAEDLKNIGLDETSLVEAGMIRGEILPSDYPMQSEQPLESAIAA